MATQSSILAWRIPQTEEPGGLQSKGVTESQTRPKQLCHCRKKSCEQGIHKTGQSEALLLLQQFQAQTGKKEEVVLKAVLCGCCTCT